jgi:hypothetical protein
MVIRDFPFDCLPTASRFVFQGFDSPLEDYLPGMTRDLCPDLDQIAMVP